MHAQNQLPPNLQTCKKKERNTPPTHKHTHTCKTLYITYFVPALQHSRVQYERKRKEGWEKKKNNNLDLVGEITVQTRLICMLGGLEVNMHERIKCYASKQTTRSLWIIVPTSEPFSSLGKQSSWFSAHLLMALPNNLEDVNLLKRKRQIKKKYDLWPRNLTKYVNKVSCKVYLPLFQCPIWLSVTKINRKIRETDKMSISNQCTVLNTELWWPIKYWRNVF